MARRVYITAAEASGDQNAAALVRSLKKLDPTIEVIGIGGPKMAAAGAVLQEETVGRAAMGWRGALRIFEALRWRKRLRQTIETTPIDLHICVDSSAVNLPLAKVSHDRGVPVLYYVAPQLWASRQGRMRKLRAYVDHVACIFPFEEEYFRKHGVNATFVGHPLFDQLPPDRLQRSSAPPRFPDRPPVIGIAPGSRSSEMASNFPGLLDIALAIRREYPKAKFLIPTVGDDRFVIYMCGNACFDPSLGVDVLIRRDAFDEFVPQCDLMLTKSGTSTVHVAAYGVPMIVVYHVNSILWHGAAKWLLNTRKIAMVNILAGQTDLVPEYIPFTDPSAAAACALDMLRHPEKLADQRAKLIELMSKLDRPGASDNAARLAIELMEKK